MTFFDLVVLSFVVYRVTRFLSLDTLIDEPRDKVAGWLLSGDVFFDEQNVRWPTDIWKRKALQWLKCPFCQSVWVAAGALTFWTIISDYEWAWAWMLHWLAISGASMAVYQFIDPD